MKKTFSKADILSGRGCYDREQVLGLSFINKEEITISDVLHSEIPLKDKRWFVFNSCDLSPKEAQRLALNLAWVVLPIFEEKYPEDKRVRECLEATEKFILGGISREELLKCKEAAADAADAADAAADAAAYAAAYAAAAAAAAADAADADAAAYAAAYAYAYAAAYTTKFIEMLEKFFE